MIGEIAGAIKEAAKVFYQWRAGAERRRMRAALDSAERYIFVSEKNGEYKDITKERQEKLLKHFRKRFFAYNQ